MILIPRLDGHSRFRFTNGVNMIAGGDLIHNSGINDEGLSRHEYISCGRPAEEQQWDWHLTLLTCL